MGFHCGGQPSVSGDILSQRGCHYPQQTCCQRAKHPRGGLVGKGQPQTEEDKECCKKSYEAEHGWFVCSMWGDSAAFGVRCLGTAFQSGDMSPHSKTYGFNNTGISLRGICCPGLTACQAKLPSPLGTTEVICARPAGTVNVPCPQTTTFTAPARVVMR